MKHYSVQVCWSVEDESFIAISAEFPGLSGIGDDAAEALAELEDARAVAIQAYVDDGDDLPEPIVLQEYSGQFRLRLPKSQHAELARLAEAEGVSLNNIVSNLISIGLGNKQAIARAEIRVTTALHASRLDASRGIELYSSYELTVDNAPRVLSSDYDFAFTKLLSRTPS